MPAHLRRINEPGHIHFWTISCHRRLAFFHHDGMKRIVITALRRLRGKFKICLVGYVVMPDHVHVLLYPHARQCDTPTTISTLLNAFKQEVGFHGKAWLREYWRAHRQLWSTPLTDWARSDDKGNRIWNTRGYDFNIRSRGKLIEKLDYCHKNPITRSLVDRAGDWPWSSYRYYEHDDQSVLAMDWDGVWPIVW